MTPQCVYEFTKELQDILNDASEAFYHPDGSVIPEKDFGELTERLTELKDKVDEILDSCAGDMYGKTVSTSQGIGKVISHGFDGKADAKGRGVLVYKVVLEGGKEEFYYDYELKVVYENK